MSTSHRTVRALAGYCRSPIAQKLLAGQPQYRQDLAGNRHLTAEQWFSMWDRKPRWEIAHALADRVLTPEQIDRVIRKERRATVIRTLLQRNTLNEAQGEVLLDRGLVDVTTANVWWNSGRVPEAHRATVAREAGPNQVVELVIKTPELGLEMVYPIASRANHSGLVDLVDSRPELIEQIVNGGHLNYSLLGAACASRHLFDQDVMNWALTRAQRESGQYLAEWLVAQGISGNPNAGPSLLEQAAQARKPGRRLATEDWRRRELRYCVTRPWEEETSPEGLNLLVKSSHTLPCRARFVGALPQLSERQRNSLTFYLASVRTPSKGQPSLEEQERDPLPADELKQVQFNHLGLPALLRPNGDTSGVVLVDFIRALEQVLDPAGEEAWATAIALIEDGWQSSIGELIDTSQAL